MKTESFTVKCYYREQGIRCEGGVLLQTDNEAALVEGTGVYCPACEGKGEILTETGRTFLEFLTKFARPFIHDVMDDLFKEREQR